MRETTQQYVKERIAVRPRDTHKGDCGRVLLVCGSVGMAGAAVLCAKAALKSGAGLVTVCVPEELFPILQTAVPEAMCVRREAVIDGAADSDPGIHIDLDRYDCIAVGPGLRVGYSQYRIVEHLLVSYHGPLVVDADGLNCLCKYGQVPEITARRKNPVILTPHPGEADRLLAHLGRRRVSELGREKAAEVLAESTGAIVVLKGADSLVAAATTAAYGAGNSRIQPDVFVNPTGNPGMATGGSGDVLTGVVAALAAWGSATSKKQQACGPAPLDAARTGVYIHGLAGDIAAERTGEFGMTAMDIAQALPEAFRRIVGR